ncbi:hypothetical protein GLYMA_13G066400v4 [Glycine max]|uniref:Uncharacterized protein n=1 Tax=Glycine max TaxID=3847 RepID=K7LXE6_SOYBN|nr:hypothetical protein JHK85_036210 [Glycine max]KHN13253.1 hypothetical protein glysoja_016430 [Glycine soja]KAG4976147.1 hypothetical protein JHK86_035621 [Glycine max]KAG5129503.1 hypothetical protein JHK84_035900 [Glycine max]KAH1100154.1 hypothetical protein GYH30_035353 [Glycine max]
MMRKKLQQYDWIRSMIPIYAIPTQYVSRDIIIDESLCHEGVDGASLMGGISAGAVSYSIALWSGVAAFTIWDWP